MTFPQPSLIHAPQTQSPDVPLQETAEQLATANSEEYQEVYQHPEDNSPQPSAIHVIYNRNKSTNPTALIQPVEPVIGLNQEEQQKKKAEPNLTLTELLGLTPCTGYVETPLQTLLYGVYVNQPSRFLPLAQEAKKLAKKLKEEQEASQWSGISPEILLNKSFTEQLNHIQVLQQIAQLYCAREHLPKDIIQILECLGKVDSTPFDKLYYLAENCADC